MSFLSKYQSGLQNGMSILSDIPVWVLVESSVIPGKNRHNGIISQILFCSKLLCDRLIRESRMSRFFMVISSATPGWDYNKKSTHPRIADEPSAICGWVDHYGCEKIGIRIWSPDWDYDFVEIPVEWVDFLWWTHPQFPDEITLKNRLNRESRMSHPQVADESTIMAVKKSASESCLQIGITIFSKSQCCV